MHECSGVDDGNDAIISVDLRHDLLRLGCATVYGNLCEDMQALICYKIISFFHIIVTLYLIIDTENDTFILRESSKSAEKSIGRLYL